MTKSQGAKANLTGNRLERFIEHILRDCGFKLVKDKRRLVDAMRGVVEPSYARQVNIGTTIYGTPLICDFLIVHPQKWRGGLVIEAKWQQVSGTVDEKYPYFVHNVYASEYETILVIDGGGYRPGAVDWLRYMQRGNLLHVFHMADFQSWVNQGNL